MSINTWIRRAGEVVRGEVTVELICTSDRTLTQLQPCDIIADTIAGNVTQFVKENGVLKEVVIGYLRTDCCVGTKFNRNQNGKNGVRLHINHQ